VPGGQWPVEKLEDIMFSQRLNQISRKSLLAFSLIALLSVLGFCLAH
jgi:hypothetical protein